MPFTYTNRKGVIYALYRISAAAGKHRYILAQQSKKGEPADDLPVGFRVKETAAGAVSVVLDEPSLIRPEEGAAVERALQHLPKAADCRVVTQHDRIELYEKIHPGRFGISSVPAKGKPARYDPVLRFVLINPTRRLFRADRAYAWGREKWVWLDRIGDIADLAAALVPDLANRSTARPTAMHRLKVTLKHSRPPIWRRLLVPSDITLDHLHDVVQVAMGWGDEHLHLFEIDGMTFSDSRYRDADIADEAGVRLDQTAPFAKTRIRYEYDFGDGWEHEILVEAVQPPEPGQHDPVCLAGERTAPPEDSGGIWHYGWMLETLADPHDPEGDELRRAIGAGRVRSGGHQPTSGWELVTW